MKTALPFTYKGYTVEKEFDLWALGYGMNYRYFKDEELHCASTVEEAMDEIDERTRGNDDEPEFDAEWEREKRAREY